MKPSIESAETENHISENAASSLLRCLLERELVCIRSGVDPKVRRIADGIVFRTANDATVCVGQVKGSGNHLRLPRRQMMKRLMSLPMPFFGVEGDTEEAMFCPASRFDVYSIEEGEWRNVGKVDVAVNPAGSVEHFSRLGPDVTSESLSFLKARADLLIFPGVEETSMNNELLAPVLKMGRIELSIKDFLALRPGDVLVFSLPSEAEATLQLCGDDWAKVSVEVEGEFLRLRVKEVARM